MASYNTTLRTPSDAKLIRTLHPKMEKLPISTCEIMETGFLVHVSIGFDFGRLFFNSYNLKQAFDVVYKDVQYVIVLFLQ